MLQKDSEDNLKESLDNFNTLVVIGAVVFFSSCFFTIPACFSMGRNESDVFGLIGVALLFVGILIIWFAGKRAEKIRKKIETNTLKRNQEEYQLLITEIKKGINQLINIINNLFTIYACSRCNETHQQLLDFNTTYTGLQLRCISCNKTTWVKINSNKPNNIEPIYRKYNSMVEKIPIYQSSVFIIDQNYPIIFDGKQYMEVSETRHSIPKKIKLFVWERDGGRCVQCGSQKNLEYDHIIPVSKGGSNTERNIQLLCEKCNRVKSNHIN